MISLDLPGCPAYDFAVEHVRPDYAGDGRRAFVKAEVERAVSVLIGEPLWTCRHAAEIATFQFGGRNKTRDFYERASEVGDHALHVLCAWRITQDDRLVVGNNDLYYPADYEHVGENFPEDFNWNLSPNRREKLLAALFDGGKREFVVQEIEVGAAGSLRLQMTDGFSLDVLPNDSLSHEQWRLFRPGKDEPHFVVTGQGLET